MVGLKMPFLDLAFFLLAQFSKYLSQMPAQIPVQHLTPALRNKNNVVLALPLRVP
jgi:hypothetical protein